MNSLKAILFVFLASVGIPPLFSQPLQPDSLRILMRDGDSLAVDVYVPGPGTYPTILIQTPYNRKFFRYIGLPMGFKYDLAGSPYAFVIADWRCFYGSLDACPIPPATLNRGEDAYDIVEWISNQAWSDGKVGSWGPSALGKIQFQLMREQHPAHICAVPLVAGSQFEYEEYYPGGALRTEYVEQLDGLGFGLSPLILAHPVYDLTWQITENLNWYPDEIQVPCLMIGGWYDHNINLQVDLFDAIRMQSPAGIREQHRFLIGPWAHGGFSGQQVGSGMQGQLSYPEAAGWSDSLAREFFDFHLRSLSNGWDLSPAVQYFQMGENQWKSGMSYPLPALNEVPFYLYPDGSLTEAQPFSGDSSLSFFYDPADPSPTIGGATLRNDLDQGPYDQSADVESRTDLLIFSTPILQQGLELNGKARVDLYVSSDRTDTDFAVRLTDVYPDGRSMLLGEGIFRMRFLNGFQTETLITPGTIYPVSVELPWLANTFLPGHRLRLLVSSANYPRFHANLNDGGPMYVPGDTLIAENMVFMSASYPSKILLPLHNSPAGIGSDPGNTSLSIFPNPLKGPLTLEFTSNCRGLAAISILDLSGRSLYVETQEVNRGGKTIIQMENPELPAGVYLLQLNLCGKLLSKKLLIP